MRTFEHLVAQLPRQRCHALVWGATDRLEHAHVGQDPIDQRIEQRPPVADMPVDTGDRDTEIVGEPAHGERVEAVLLDDATSGLYYVLRGERRRRDGALVVVRRCAACRRFGAHTGYSAKS